MVKKISNMYELITEENMNLVLNYDFTTDYYKEILKQINEHGSSNLSLDYNLSPLENVKRIWSNQTGRSWVLSGSSIPSKGTLAWKGPGTC